MINPKSYFAIRSACYTPFVAKPASKKIARYTKGTSVRLLPSTADSLRDIRYHWKIESGEVLRLAAEALEAAYEADPENPPKSITIDLNKLTESDD